MHLPIALDVFCGVGGMSLGFEQAGFNVVSGLDFDRLNSEAYSINFPKAHALCRDVATIDGATIREVSEIRSKAIAVVFGGSPCQGFSAGGKRVEDDPRNKLIDEFARLVIELSPDYFVLENVVGLLSRRASAILDSFVARVTIGGYVIVTPIRVLNAQEFGVPQRRRRVFLLGYRNSLAAPTYPDIDNPIARTGSVQWDSSVWDAIGDLPNVDEFESLVDTDVLQAKLGTGSRYAKLLRGELVDLTDRSYARTHIPDHLTGCLRTAHSPDIIRRFSEVVPGVREPISRFFRLSKDGVSPTIRAGSGPTHGSYTAPRPIHPVHPRCITVREAARLQGFPDWFQFHPTKWHGFRQVGNAVPPPLARAVAAEIYAMLTRTTRTHHTTSE